MVESRRRLSPLMVKVTLPKQVIVSLNESILQRDIWRGFRVLISQLGIEKGSSVGR